MLQLSFGVCRNELTGLKWYMRIWTATRHNKSLEWSAFMCDQGYFILCGDPFNKMRFMGVDMDKMMYVMEKMLLCGFNEMMKRCAEGPEKEPDDWYFTGTQE